MLLGHIHNY